MIKMIFTYFVLVILLIALELLLIWIVLLIRDKADEDSPKEEEKEDLCEHEWQFVGFDNSKLSMGILQCIYQCKKCGKIISI